MVGGASGAPTRLPTTNQSVTWATGETVIGIIRLAGSAVSDHILLGKHGKQLSGRQRHLGLGSVGRLRLTIRSIVPFAIASLTGPSVLPLCDSP